MNHSALFVNSRTGPKIVIAAGGGRDGDEKYIKGNSYGMVYITEANDCHPNFIKETFDRTLASKNRKIFHDLNPKGKGHFYYTDILNFHEKKQLLNRSYGYNYGHFTIADNLSLSDAQIKSIIDSYDHSSVWYRRDILGLRETADGLIYPMFKQSLHVVPAVDRPYERYFVSMDYGILNATSIALWGLFDGVWFRVREYYHSGRDSEDRRTDEEYYSELLKLVGNLPVEKVIVDPSAASFITLIRRKATFSVKNADNDVLNGIRNCASALKQGIVKINDCCFSFISEILNYVWDKSAEKNGSEKPLSLNDHAMDDFRYFVRTTKIAEPPRGFF